MKVATIALAAILSTGISLAGESEEDPPTSIDVSFCDLLKDPASFVGKHIRIRVIYSHAFGPQRLQPPTCCPIPYIGINVRFDTDISGRSEKLFYKLDDNPGVALVVFTGVFEGEGPYGYFSDKYQLNVDGIDKIEHISKLPEDDPSWVPKNCR